MSLSVDTAKSNAEEAGIVMKTSEENATGNTVKVVEHPPVEKNEENQQPEDGNNTDNNGSSSEDDSSGEESNSDSDSGSGSETGEEGGEEEEEEEDDENPEEKSDENPAKPAKPAVEKPNAADNAEKSDKSADKGMDVDENPAEETADKGMDVDENPDETAEPVDETRFNALIKKLSHGGGHVPKCAAWTLTGTFMDVEESYLFFVFTMLAQSLNWNTVSLENIYNDLCAKFVDKSKPVTLSYKFYKWINHKDQNDLRTEINEGCSAESSMKWRENFIPLLLAQVDTENEARNSITHIYILFCEECVDNNREMKLYPSMEFYESKNDKGIKRIEKRDRHQHPIMGKTDCCLGLLPYMPFHVPQDRKPETPNTDGMTLDEKIECLKRCKSKLMDEEEDNGIVPRLLKAVFKNIERSSKMKDVFALLKRELCIIMNELDDVALEKMAQYAKLMVESFRSNKAKVKVQLPQLLLSGNKLAKGMNVNFGNFHGEKLTEEELAFTKNLQKLFTKDFVSHANLVDLFNLSQCYLSAGSNFRHASKKLNATVAELRKVLNTDAKYDYAANSKAPDTPKTNKKPNNKKRKGEGNTDTDKKKQKLKHKTNNKPNTDRVVIEGEEPRTAQTAP